MASWIILDWDHDQFHLLTAESSRRGVHVTKAATWAHPEPFTPSTAERVGKALRDFLKSAGIAPAPVIVGLGRDRVFLKELRVPPIAAHEEAALVRFQTAKELAEPADNYAVDYVQLNAGSGEREIMTVATRREVLTSIQTLCLAAGLKLHAVTPRLFGIALALQRAIEPEPNPLVAGKLNVVLSIGQRWAELCFFKGARLIQAQALANGPLLVNEVKRNLAVFRAQHAVDMEMTGPDCLYVFGDDPAAMQTMQSGQASAGPHAQSARCGAGGRRGGEESGVLRRVGRPGVALVACESTPGQLGLAQEVEPADQHRAAAAASSTARWRRRCWRSSS